MMKNALYGGVNAAVLTAMHADLSIDIERTAAHGRWLLANGCNGLGVLGTTGEANSLGISERLALMEGLVERGLSPGLLLPGVGTPALTDTVLLARRAAELGCPGVLVLPPFFYKNPSEDGLFAYFSELVQRLDASTKIYLYHFPQQSAVPFTFDLVARLLKSFPGKIAGLKDSSGDLANTLGYIEHFAADGFEVYCGDDSALLDVLKSGAAGCITAAANVGSKVSAMVVANWENDAAIEPQAKLKSLRKLFTSVPLIPSLKAVLRRQLDDPAWLHVRPPHLGLSEEAMQRLFAALDACTLPLAKVA